MTRADIIVVAAALLLLPMLYLGLWGNPAQGRQVRVIVAEQATILADLGRQQTLSVKGAMGKSKVEIRAGRVRFVDSPCRGKLCMHRGWIAAAGDVAACLPNQVAVQVLGRDRRFDAVNF